MATPVPISQVCLELEWNYEYNHAFFLVTIIQLPQLSYCQYSYDPPVQLWSYMSPNFFLGLALLILAVTQTLKQTFSMYKATKSWQPNQYMRLLVRDGIAYFLVYVSPSLLPANN